MEYLWKITFEEGHTFQLEPHEQEELLTKLRAAAIEEEYKVAVPLSGELQEFIEFILWGQDTVRLKMLLTVAFGDDRGIDETLPGHNISQVQSPYRMIVHNNKYRLAF